MHKPNRKKGFTLIELMVVVAIMGLLAALAVISLNNARERARDARRVSDVKQVQTALELYYLDNHEYPDATDKTLGGNCISETNGIKADCSGTVYMRLAPTNPQPQDDGSCDDTDYIYTADTAHGSALESYHIDYCLGSETGDISGTSHSATPAGLADD